MSRSRKRMSPPSNGAAAPFPSLTATAHSLRAASTEAPSVGRVWRRRVLLVACASALGSLFGFAAKPKPSGAPVAGIPALKRTDDGDLQRWANGRISVVLDPSLERVSRRAPDAVVRSFGKWLAAAQELPDIEFVHGRESQP